MCEKITLFENGKMLSNDEEIAECFKDYFINITDSLDIVPNQLTVEEYKDHPSVRMIKQPVDSNTFKFSHVGPTEVLKHIYLLDGKKSSSGNIPTDVLKATEELT